MKTYIVTSAIPSFKIGYVFPQPSERDRMKEWLEKEYPSITFYTGETDQHSGAIYWDLPEFP